MRLHGEREGGRTLQSLKAHAPGQEEAIKGIAMDGRPSGKHDLVNLLSLKVGPHVEVERGLRPVDAPVSDSSEPDWVGCSPGRKELLALGGKLRDEREVALHTDAVLIAPLADSTTVAEGQEQLLGNAPGHSVVRGCGIEDLITLREVPVLGGPVAQAVHHELPLDGKLGVHDVDVHVAQADAKEILDLTGEEGHGQQGEVGGDLA